MGSPRRRRKWWTDHSSLAAGDGTRPKSHPHYVRNRWPPSDEYGVGTQEEPSSADPVVAIYHVALPQVYGYLLPRCGNAAVAEDLTAETFMAAVGATKQRHVPEVSVAWLVGIARHKLVDYWRRAAREQRSLAVVESASEGLADPWEEWLDAEVAHAALLRLPHPQRVALLALLAAAETSAAVRVDDRHRQGGRVHDALELP